MNLCDVRHGDCAELLRQHDGNLFDALVTDPPYGLAQNIDVTEVVKSWVDGTSVTGTGFLGETWDASVPPPALWSEVLRTMKPGAHGVVFAGTRTTDLMSMSLRFAGFQVRDTLMWIYSTGFSKSGSLGDVEGREGWGAALKPAYEPILLVRKPFEGTLKQCVEQYGTGALNLNATKLVSGRAASNFMLQHTLGCVVVGERKVKGNNQTSDRAHGPSTPTWDGRWEAKAGAGYAGADGTETVQQWDCEDGCPVKLLETVTGDVGKSRFFYCPKASTKERELGVAKPEGKERGNKHPTVKPVELMRWLVRLTAPEGGLVVDPFAGSGTTGVAANLENVRSLLIEQDGQYVDVARQRTFGKSALPSDH